MPPVKGQQAEIAESLEDSIAASFDSMEAEEEEVVEETEVSEEEIEETPEEDVEGDSEEPEEVGEDDGEVSDELKEEIQEASDSDYNEPAPERWPSKIKEVYNSLPPNARKAMLEDIYKPMQATYTHATQELSQMRKAYEPIMETLRQHQNDFQRLGVDPQEAFRTQMAWAKHIADVGPEKAIEDMRAAYGIGQNGAQGQQEKYLTPVEREMMTKLKSLEESLTNQTRMTENQQRQLAERQKQERYAQINSGLSDFINEKKDGKPAHPHIEKVAPAIAGLIRGGLVRPVDDYGQPLSVRDQVAQAYEMACNLDPSIRTASSRIDRGQAARTRAAKTVDVVAKTPAGQVSVPDKPLASDLDELYDKLSRRVG